MYMELIVCQNLPHKHNLLYIFIHVRHVRVCERTDQIVLFCGVLVECLYRHISRIAST